MDTAKNNILKKIRMALAKPTPLPFPGIDTASSVVQPLQQDIVVEFAEQFTKLQGKFSYCESRQELQSQLQELFHQQQWTKIFCSEEALQNNVEPKLWTDDINTCDASLSSCEALVARTGSIVLSAAANGRIPTVYAPVHVCVATTTQIVYDIKDALDVLKKKYKQLPSAITFATGPSRTADIEKTLVVGVHGPKEVFCFIVDDNNDK